MADEKTAGLVPDKLDLMGRLATSALGGFGGAITGTGAGLLLRARYEDKLKDKRDHTTKDKLLSKAPLLGALAGIVGGGAYGHSVGKKMMGKLGHPVLRGFYKAAALNAEVQLKPHQTRALERLDDPGNNNSLLAAHPTGSGKTLTAIASFEKLRKAGKAVRAIVVVPASLRENFVENGVKKFTNSTSAVYGPKNERHNLDVGQPSKADYNVVSYELFRQHHAQILADTGADTLIMDEVHKVRDEQGSTYNMLREVRPKFKQAITLTGSIVNNEPADVVPLMDVTFGPGSHKLVNKKFFDNLFVQKDAKKVGFFSPKVEITKSLKNKPQLAKYLGNKIDYVGRDEVSGDMPDKKTIDVEVTMTPDQKKLYDFSMSSVDPITRWKIRNNIPVGQREARDAFSKLLQARQVATDPGLFDKRLEGKNPADYSPKVRAVLDDAKAHLAAHPENRTVIYHNLLRGGLDAVEKALKAEDMHYDKFVGSGQEGVTADTRSKAIKDFNANKTRILLLSSAGAQGLDLKHGTMMQMMEGHYNPEMIQQAEARVMRMGSLAHRPEAERKVEIRRYYAVPEASGLAKFMPKGNKGVDHWIYSIAKRKDDLNKDFRDVIEKRASDDDAVDMGSLLKGLQERATSAFGEMPAELRANVGSVIGALGGEGKKPAHEARSPHQVGQPRTLGLPRSSGDHSLLGIEELAPGSERLVLDAAADMLVDQYGHTIGRIVGSIPGNFIGRRVSAGAEKAVEAKMKQMLLDRGMESLTKKQHYSKILAESKLDERVIDAKAGLELAMTGLPILWQLHSMGGGGGKATKAINSTLDKAFTTILPAKWKNNPIARAAVPAVAAGITFGLATPILSALAKQKILSGAVGGGKDLDVGITRYSDKLRKKMERKYVGSKSYVNEFETKKELGIDTIA
jgi:superfamily II DNA or RNA helicase